LDEITFSRIFSSSLEISWISWHDKHGSLVN
jgi:hypothetical protein